MPYRWGAPVVVSVVAITASSWIGTAPNLAAGMVAGAWATALLMWADPW